MVSLFIRNFFFTVLQPGIVAGLIPYVILRREWKGFPDNLHMFQYLAVLLFTMGFITMCHCIFRFAVEGKGTLSPIDRTKHLVVEGLYRYSRNPMYIGVMLMLVSISWFTTSKNMWIYSGGVFIAFNLFILIIEEPRLRRDFGAEYSMYCERVRRWV